MCGLFGVIGYGEKIDNLNCLVTDLAVASAERGTDATGIAFNNKKMLHVFKQAKSAYQFKVDLPKEVTSVLGHTRHATQGNKNKLINNHPFSGKVKYQHFALAHNGILANDIRLRNKFNLPKTKVETDSYIAVQLIESKKYLDMESIKFMAESIEGSFSISILDGYNNTYLIKGDNPLSILHFPKLKLYVYASTDKILWKAIVESTLFKHLKDGVAEEIKINGGDILKICNDGKLIYDKFNYSDYSDYGYFNWWNCRSEVADLSENNSYFEDLKMIAAYQGFSPEQVDVLYGEGWSLEEIEEFIYTEDCLEV